MSETAGGGEKREKATPRRLRDARKEGQVASSRDLSRTATSLVWLFLLVALPGYYFAHLAELATAALRLIDSPSNEDLVPFLWSAGNVVLTLVLPPVALVAAVGAAATRMQTGPVFSFARIQPKLSNLSPAAGVKRVFSAANLFETLKGLVKTGLIAGTVALVIHVGADDFLQLTTQSPIVVGQVDHWLHVLVLAVSSGLLLAVSVGDWLFQRFNFLRSLRMSTQEIRREHQTHEGDPQLRSQRRRLQRQWATGNARQAARNATALVVNPTHIAVAIFYEQESTEIPLVTATGEGQLAALMRSEAETAGVPVLRSIALARKLHFLCEADEEIPERMFDAVAEVLAWAATVREAREADGETPLFRDSGRDFERLIDPD